VDKAAALKQAGLQSELIHSNLSVAEEATLKEVYASWADRHGPACQSGLRVCRRQARCHQSA
jgi:hypothetical protein